MNGNRVWDILMEMLEQFHAGTLEPKRVREMQQLLRAFHQAALVEQTLASVRLQDAKAAEALGMGRQPKMLTSAAGDQEYLCDVS